MTPQRIQRKRTKGYRLPLNTVSVTRPGKWGNPYKVGELCHNPVGTGLIMPSTLHECIVFHQLYIKSCMGNKDSWIHQHLYELKGKNLACFCKEGDECHADTLLKVANP